MKFGIKAIALAVTLAAASTGAQAGITSPANGAQGELFLTIWNPVVGHEASFTIGLGVTAPSTDSSGNVVAGTFNGGSSLTPSITTNLFSNAGFTSVFGATQFADQASWKWNVVGASSLGDQSTLLFTSATNTFATVQGGAVDNAATKTLDFLTAVNGLTSGSVNGGKSGGTTNSASAAFAGSNWGSNINGSMGSLNDAASVGGSLYFYSAVNNSVASGTYDATDPAVQSLYTNVWTLDATTGTLTYAAASQVPVPAAAWLLGSGLMGLFGVSRRRAVKAAA